MPKWPLRIVKLAQVSIGVAILLLALAAVFLLIFPRSFSVDTLFVANYLGSWMVGLSIACLILVLAESIMRRSWRL
jgi:hypothetical protein